MMSSLPHQTPAGVGLGGVGPVEVVAVDGILGDRG